jgi:serine/threonine protein kinase
MAEPISQNDFEPKTLAGRPPGGGNGDDAGASGMIWAVIQGERRSDEPRYKILGELGRGGMGHVLRAVDNDLRREVALKEIAPSFLSSPEHVTRFLREARITGRLEHPAIIPVYEIGRQKIGDQESWYYTMRLVHGRTLKRALLDFHKKYADAAVEFRTVEGQRLLDAVIAACHAVAFAHSRGVIHRDLKPDNIMLGDYGETVLLDWGLAKVLGAELAAEDLPGARTVEIVDHGQTEAGAVMGTPQYLAPEQAAGRRDLIDSQTDVYSFGVVLFQVLTGELPFGEARAQEVLRLVQERLPEAPASRRRGVSAELSAICMKALAPDRSVRYRSPSDLALELRRWIADEPVEAYREPLTRRVRRWAAKHRGLTSAAAVALLLNLVRLGWDWADEAIKQRRIRSEARSSIGSRGAPAAEPWEDLPWSRFRRGVLRLRVEDYDTAIAEFDRAARLEPENPLPMMGKAVSQARLGMTEEAKATTLAAEGRLRLVQSRGLLLPETLRSEEVFQLIRKEPLLREATLGWDRAPE